MTNEYSKNTTSVRKLAAILFADIVDYTSLMQTNEHHASTLLRHFQQQLEEKVANHNGRIVNFYGDGCLCTFQIPLDAVRCGIALQSAFRQTPNVPVRIGIHSGTVTMEGDKIFGDSVNITSRIESMGVAGSILLSKKVRDEVKNNPDLELRSLGSFEFKNVEEPMEVYALANEGLMIPKKKEIQGKLSTQKRKTTPLILTGVLIGLLLLAGLWYAMTGTSKNPISIEKSIAVLPFKDMSPQQDQEYFCDGVAEEILNALSQLKDLKVAGRLSSFSFKDKTDVGIDEIGQQLNVNTILNGSIRKNGDQIRVTANLVNVEDGFQIWSDVYDEELKDIFSIQERIAENIVEKFKLVQSFEKGQNLLSNTTDNLEAYEQYLKGMFYLNKSLDGIDPARMAFKKAIELDTNYARAYAGLSEIHWAETVFGLDLRATAFENMRRAASKAIELDPNNAKAYQWLGYYTCLYQLDWVSGSEYLKKATELNPGLEAGAIVVQVLADPRPEILERLVQAQQKLVERDPLSISALLDLNRVHLLNQQFDKVIENAQKIFELDPNQRSNMRHISEAYLYTSQPEKALPYTERMIQKNNYAYHDYIRCLVDLNRKAEAQQKFNTMKDSLDAFAKAYCHFALDQIDEGFHFLDLAVDEGDPRFPFERIWSPMEAYKRDPRYQAIEAKLNFPKALKD